MYTAQVEAQEAVSIIAETSRYMLALNRSGDLYSEIVSRGSQFALLRQFVSDDGRIVSVEQPILKSTPLFLVRVES